ncbi:MAG TPA: phage baseplate assembly protein V [Thermoanaerobaculia bacterium]|jgi:hypothetical protein
MTTPFDQLLPRVHEITRFFGKHRGLVTEVDDPLAIGRIRATVPELFGTESTGWALPALPYCGENQGFHTIPPIGAGVWIEFEAGDVARPIWSGCWWSEGTLPQDEKGKEAKPPLKILRSSEGMLIALDDDAKTITLSDSSGKNLLSIKTTSGQIVLKAATKIVIESPQIDMVQGASHPMVFGDDLLKYLNEMVINFNTHMHPGQTAGPLPVTPMIPTPPMTPPLPTLLSMKVKAG